MTINQDEPKYPRNNPAHSKYIASKSASGASGCARNARRFSFTKRALDALPLPDRGYAVYNDSGQHGLQLWVFPSGAKTFYLYYSFENRPDRVKIGRWPDVSVDQARTEAKRLWGVIAQKQNPAKQKRTIRDDRQLGWLFDDYLENYARTQKRTWYQEQSTWNCHLKERFSQRKLSSITQPELQRLHTELSKRIPFQANRVIELVVKLFDYARTHYGWGGANPARGIKANRERKRARFLEAEELPRLFESLAEELNTTMRDYFMTCLFTGGRSRRNVAEMRWEEIHWRRAVWVIPGEKFKNGEQEENLLIPEIVALLRQRHEADDRDSVWVFPGTGRTGHLAEPKSAWKRILKRAKIMNCRIHDLRRTYGSWQAMTGASLVMIGAALGHKSPDSTMIYARLQRDPVRRAIEQATAAIKTVGRMPAGLLPPVKSDD